MPEELKIVADRADAIFNGYAFTVEGDRIRILNLNAPHHASVISLQEEVLETSMDDIEISLVLDYYSRVKKYMERCDA